MVGRGGARGPALGSGMARGEVCHMWGMRGYVGFGGWFGRFGVCSGGCFWWGGGGLVVCGFRAGLGGCGLREGSGGDGGVCWGEVGEGGGRMGWEGECDGFGLEEEERDGG